MKRRKQRLDQTGGVKAAATELLERRLSAPEDLIRTGRDQQLDDMDEGYKKIQRRVDDALNTVFKRLDVLEYPQRERDARKAEHEAKQREESAMQRQAKESAMQRQGKRGTRGDRGLSPAEIRSERAILLHGKIGNAVGACGLYSDLRGRPGGR